MHVWPGPAAEGTREGQAPTPGSPNLEAEEVQSSHGEGQFLLLAVP